MPRVIDIWQVERPELPRSLLGETVRWHARSGRVIYADIMGRKLLAYDPLTGQQDDWSFEAPVGGWFPTIRDEIILAVGQNLDWFDMKTGSRRPLASLVGEDADIRFNDGRCDPAGRLWISTMSMSGNPPPPKGRLFRLDPPGILTPVIDGLRIPNTLAWSPDGNSMYFADSLTRETGRYGYDPQSGELGARSALFRFSDAVSGIPDGACVDEEGGIWIAVPRGSRVERRMPDGSLDTVILLPAERPTMCAFGGADRDILFITSQSLFLSEEERRFRVNDGAFFAVRPGVTGLPEAQFDPDTIRN